MNSEDNGKGEETALLTAEKQAIADATETMKDLTESGNDATTLTDKLGVLQRVVTAVAKDEEYRQILLLAAFDNKQEAMLAADAITERQRYGVSIHPILTRVIAQCAIQAGRVDKVLNAMTSYSLNMNNRGHLPSWKRKQEDKSLA